MKIGVLGGTFDPIHQGHLVIAEEVVTRLNLAEILFVPAGQPWLKMDYPVSAAEHRVQMVRLAIAGKPGFKLSTMEIERAGPTYTVDTIVQLQAQLGAGTELFFILGWDNLNELPQWREPARLVKLCHLVAVPRPNYPLPDLNSLEAAIPGLTSSTIILDTPEIDISASEIRQRVAQGLSISHLVPEPVDRYIREHRLYTTT
ncbi:MAG TPA: nicotinate-nucleotide adenylyltransferase [Dehalococcoidales bacterium]|nr:nicotinate-nucleotide adenylyltransferase [Dehalococcoidales bacterium]